MINKRIPYRKVSLSHRLARLLMLSLVPQLAFQAHPLLANPTGGSVAGGTAAIESSGNTTTITTSDRAVINWQGFSVGAGETTQFVQPSSSSAVLNRVTSGDPSHLLGNLQANGQVYLLNPNGVFIGNGAVINVGSFLATTANIADTDFLKGGNLSFTGATDAPIINQGSIFASSGDVFLLARTVQNTESGTISAPRGTVGLAAGKQFYLKKDEIGSMQVEVRAEAVPGAKGGTGLDNAGLLEAMRVQMAADGNLYGLAINQQGMVRATGVSKAADGTITLSAPGGKIMQGGTLSAANLDGSGGRLSISGQDVILQASSLATAAGVIDGGSIEVDATGDTFVSGRLSVDGATGKAGRIKLTGDRVGLFDANLSADGATAGGTVLVGGDYAGLNPLVKNASRTYVSKDSVISADATIAGDGGKVVIWSDNGTQFYGSISAQGGSVSGNGGFVEVSGKDYLDYRGTVNTLAANGQTGMLLLDPSELKINNTSDANLVFGGNPFAPDGAGDSVLTWRTINQALLSSSVTVNTGAAGTGTGKITIDEKGELTSLFGGKSLTITASDGAGGGSIVIGADITSTGNGSLTFNSGGTGTISIGAITIQTATGNVSFNGATVLTGNAVITVNNGVITFGSTLDGTVAGAQSLELRAGNITFTGAVGGGTRLGAVTVNSAGTVLASSTFNANSYTQKFGTVATTFANLLTLTGAFDFKGTALNINFVGNNTVGTTMKVTNSGLFTTANGANLTVVNQFTQNDTNDTGLNSLGGNIASTADGISFQSGVTLSNGILMSTGEGAGDDIVFSSTLNGAQSLGLTAGAGNITFTGAVGGGTRLGAVTVVSGATVSASQGFSAASFTQNAGSVATTFTGLLNLTGLFNFTGTALNINGSGANTVGGAMTVSNAGLFTTANGANLTVGTEFIQNGAGVNSLGGNIASTADGIAFATAVTLASGITMTTGEGAGDDIVFSSTLDGLAAGAQSLELRAGALGDITFNAAVGGTRLGAITIKLADDVTANAITAASLEQQSGTGTTTFNGAQNYNAVAGLNVVTDTIALNQSVTTTSGGSVTLNANNFIPGGDAGNLTITAAGDITSDGAVNLTGQTGIITAGDVTTTGDVVNYNSATTLTGGVVVNSTIGGATGVTITFGSTLNGTAAGAQNLTMTAGTGGNVVFTGAVGGTTRLGAITISSANDVTAPAITAASLTQTIGQGTTTFNGAQNYNTATGLNVLTDTIALNQSVTTTSGGIVTLNANNLGGAAAGTLTIAVAGGITSAGNVILIGNQGVSIGSAILVGTGATPANLILGDGSQTGSINQIAGNLFVSGTTQIQGKNTRVGNVSLFQPLNDFVGAVSIIDVKGISLFDRNALSLAEASTSGGQVFQAVDRITTTGAGGFIARNGNGILLYSQTGGVTLGAGSSFNSALTQMVLADGASFINNGAGAMTGTTQIFSTSRLLNSPATFNGGLSGFQPRFGVQPTAVTVGSDINDAGTFNVTYTGGPLPANAMAFRNAFVDNLYSNEYFTLDLNIANLTSIPVSSAAISLYLPSRDPVIFGAIIPTSPSSGSSTADGPIRVRSRGGQENKL